MNSTTQQKRMPTIHQLHADIKDLQKQGADHVLQPFAKICLKEVPWVLKAKAILEVTVMKWHTTLKPAIADFETAISTGKFVAGDILNVANDRSTGYYFIYENSAGALQLQCTEGDYGIILPKEAYPYVRSFGAMAYATLSTGVPALFGCGIPYNIARIHRDGLKKLKIPLKKALLAWYPTRGGGGFENIHNVKFAGENIVDGLIYEMTDNIYSDILDGHKK